ncbi:GrpB family protein [Gracilibacillus oryzae]|uniref:GrpB family protein n=1 Tax=Gracilibacillus oryzae TaxID=1672701 RepID=A0A7C8KWL2_9BACI|nr:GrpB family protein [Gracilibacillus oryzae]KAB8127488.1 GrpB family protein [Gracilibacillus oryzae]
MTKTVVRLAAYNPAWEEQFRYEKQRILSVLGDKAIRIEHIGSTSIYGLSAKPIIDILAGVEDLEIVDHIITPLEKVNYEYIPKPEIMDRKFFRKGPWGQGTVHLHICQHNGKEWVEKLLFRDYLRSHPQAAKAYEDLKMELANLHTYDRQTYTKKKEPFIREIIQSARKTM